MLMDKGVLNALALRNLEPPGSLQQLAAEQVAKEASSYSGAGLREALRFNESVRQPMIQQRAHEIARWHADKKRWNEAKEFERQLDGANAAHLGNEAAALRAKSNADLARLERPVYDRASRLAGFKLYEECELPEYTDDFIYFVCQRLGLSQADEAVSMGLQMTRQHFGEALAVTMDLPLAASSTLLHQLWQEYKQQQPRRSRRLAGRQPETFYGYQ